MFENIRADIRRREESPRIINVLLLLWRDNGIQALLVYRFGRWLRSIRARPFGWVIVVFYPLYWLLAVFIRKVSGIILEQSADIGPGLNIGHFGGIEVRHCRIGPYCSIQQQVKLMPAETHGNGPVIGQRVWIGAHARVCGDISVGDGSTVSAGTVVTQNIPERCLVLGNPGRIAQKDYDNEAFL